ncbi:LapA family protein [Rhizobium terrae]|uniref:LapA family protein n=1 Tax=Rhizobium terrae TaxID=2171756 RepID=UPI000E3D5D27|nr:LapA family protein [Rhizobium terrae]
MNKLKKIISLAIFVPLGIVLIVLAVANRQTVTLALNPFRPEDGVLSVSAPLFLFLFIAVLIGMLIGWAVTWIGQGKHRKQARIEAREAVKWQNEHKAVVAGRTASSQLPSK